MVGIYRNFNSILTESKKEAAEVKSQRISRIYYVSVATAKANNYSHHFFKGSTTQNVLIDRTRRSRFSLAFLRAYSELVSAKGGQSKLSVNNYGQ